MVEDVFSKMSNILHTYNKTHKFSGENNHVFLVTPYTALCIREHYEADFLGHVLEPLRYRGYRIWKLKGNNDRLILFAEVHQAMNTGCLFDESSTWKYLKEKEVRKEMAIDYKAEWEKLILWCGAFGVNIPHEAVSVSLRSIMENQIAGTISKREKLMEEYVKEMIRTNIEGGTKHFHIVKVNAHDLLLMDKLHVSKADFAAWLKNRKEVK